MEFKQNSTKNTKIKRIVYVKHIFWGTSNNIKEIQTIENAIPNLFEYKYLQSKNRYASKRRKNKNIL